MFLSGTADLSNASGWTIQYGEVTEVTLTENGVPTGDFTLKDENWSNSYDEDTNMIKLTLSGSMENGASAEIILHFKAATDDTSQTDSMNIFKSWWKYSAGGTSMVDAGEVYNFGTLLQNGKVNGTVYLDTNRNGVKDMGETGIAGVTVKVTDSENRTYETQTGADGTYSFNSLPGNKPLNLTVINPSSPDPNNSGGSYRFYGGDVAPADDNSSASKSNFTLTDGTATVDAGLITPYTIPVSAGEHGSVSPASVKAYGTQKLSDVLEQAPAVTPASGWLFSGQWTCGTNTVAHDALLSEQVSGDATYTAQLAAVPSGTITGTTSITLKTPADDNTNSTTLAVSLDNQSSLSGLTYQWQKLGSGSDWADIENAAGESLSLTALTMNDNGAQYRCIVKNGIASATIGPVTLSVQKGDQDMPSASAAQPSIIGGTGSISGLTTAMEVSTDNGSTWTTVDGSTASNGITDIASGTTYCIRYAETEYLNASPVQTITIGSFNPSKEPTPTGTFEASTMILSGVENGQQYKIGADGTWTAITGSTVDLSDAGLVGGSVIYIYKPGNGTTTTDSDQQRITLTQAAKPAGTATDETSYQGEDGTITIADHTSGRYNYQISSDNGASWTDAAVSEQGVISGLAPGTYVIRVKGQGTMLASEPSDSLTVKPYVRNSEAEITAFKVTVDGTEYPGTIDQEAGTISITLPVGTDPSVLNSLTPSVTYAGQSISPDSTPQDFSSAGVTYTVAAEDGTTKIYTATITIARQEDYTITVTPADIIICMGGKPYEGAVDETGAIIYNENAGLPEPGFTVQLPGALIGMDVTSLTFQEKDGSRRWSFQPYDGQAGTTVYRLVPAEGQEATRVQFTKADGTVIPGDKFEVGLEVNTSFKIELYKGSGETAVGDIIVEVGGVEYAVDSSATGTLTVRGTTEDVSITSVSATAPTGGKPGAVANAGTTYTINNGEVEVIGGDVSLLFDNIIDHTGNDRTGKLEERAFEWLTSQGTTPTTEHRFVYQLKYLDLVDLDLVDANNGNAWVKASNDLTIYWPLPEGADTDTLKVLHFKGLHRDMTTGQIESEIAKCEVEIISSTISGNYVTFNVGTAGFSPFALVWQEAIPANTHTITATASSGGTIDPSGTVSVADGNSQTFTFAPYSGYYISSVVVDGQSISWAGNSYTFTNVTANHTITVTFAKSGGGSGSGNTYYTIDAEAGHGGSITPEGRILVASGGDKTFTITPDEGYRIADVLVDGESIGVVSSYTFENVRSDHTIEVIFERYSGVADPDDTGVSEWLDISNHRDYLHGYNDGSFKPDQDMTRGEVAQMFYNLLLEKNVSYRSAFSDVTENMWYADAVNTLASLGVIEGVGNGLYAPDRAVTRAEFVVIAMRFARLDTSGENIFSDVGTDDWFYEQVVGSIKYGWITGYPDGTFRPDNTISRAEVATIVNRMLARSADKAFIDSYAGEMKTFTDVSFSYWAYYDIMEAANAHGYGKHNGTEMWSYLF